MSFYGSYPIEGGGATGVTVDFGDGSDGAAVLDGTNTFSWASKSGSTYTLLRQVYLTNLTINSGIILIAAAYAIFGTGTLTNAGTIHANGGAGAAGAAGVGGVQGTPLAVPGGALELQELALALTDPSAPDCTGGNGAMTDAGGGGDGSTVASTLTWIGTLSGNGGSGGTGSGGAAGPGGTGQPPAIGGGVTFRKLNNILTHYAFALTSYQPLGAGLAGAGGGGGGGDTTNSGGGGGGGGAGAGVVAIFFNTINNTGSILANGGAGGAGETPVAGDCGGGGGGGGGTGGWVYIVASTWTAQGTIHANGGAGGAPGLKIGTGTNGIVGIAGTAGIVQKYQSSTGTWL